MPALRTPKEKWVEEGLRTLAAEGVDAVRVEALAKALGVTKGGFYGYFDNRQALLMAMLDAWERQVVDEVLERVAQESDDPVERALLAGRLTFSDALIGIDLAVRDWARRDAVVRRRLRSVDNRRLDVVREAMATFCDDADEVEARSLLAFCMSIGVHLIAADHPGRTDEQVRARAASLLLQRPVDGWVTTEDE